MRRDLNKYCDLFSFGIVLFLVLLALVRFHYLPQGVDVYYHLSSANGFLSSGGWTGWSWWDFAPQGRPQLYPPLYHLLLAFLCKAGMSGLTAVRSSEIIVSCLFFFTLWHIVRSLVSPAAGCFVLLAASSFFSFYASTFSHLPATLALIFGLWSWYRLRQKCWVSAAAFLVLSFYSHAGIPLIFAVSFLFSLAHEEYRAVSVKTLLVSALCALPFFVHLFRYRGFINLTVAYESHFIHFSIFLVCFGICGLLRNRRRDLPSLLFLGYLAGSVIVFYKYPYRFFSAQGVLGPVFFAWYFFADITGSVPARTGKIMWSAVILFLLFFHSTIDLREGRPVVTACNSTYSNYFFGRTDTLLEFKSVYAPRYYGKWLEVIRRSSQPGEIVVSNMPIVSQILSALSAHPTSYPMLAEVGTPVSRESLYAPAKVIVWVRPEDRLRERFAGALGWKTVYEDEICLVFVNPSVSVRAGPPGPAAVPFVCAGTAVLFFLFLGTVYPALSGHFQGRQVGK